MNRETVFLAPYMLGRGGLLWNINERRILAGDDKVFGAIAIMRSVDGRAMGSGAGINGAEARIRAIGEAVERYCLTSPRPFVNAFASQLPGRVLNLDEWPSYSEKQLSANAFPYEIYDHYRRRDWYRCRSLCDCEDIWLPARAVFIGNNVDDGYFGITTSTGAACHYDRNLAILSGMYEVVERDAFTIVWESCSETLLLDPDCDEQDHFVRAVSCTCKKNGRRLFLRDMTTDVGVPAVLAVLHDTADRSPAIAIGCSARASFREACKAATSEAIQTWSWMHEERLSRPITLEDATFRVQRPDGMIYHPLLYSFPQSVPKARHLLAETITRKIESFTGFKDSSAELEWLVAQVQHAGVEPIVADVTLPECEKLGLSVIKVVIPGLVPLSAGVWYRHLANKRISTVPKSRDWPHREPSSIAVPHPLP